jgi:GrpB-like predicted nucleotidyltransferase (UPF0157 family)
MDRRPISLIPSDPSWAALATAESAAIHSACAPHIVHVEHIGSTAVPGLIAKPVIDLMPLLARFEDGLACIQPMQSLGYSYRGEHGIPGRHLFIKGVPRTHNVHMFVGGTPDHLRHIRFRDYLREHADVAAEYAELKRRLAAQFVDDVEAYAAAKSDFVRRIEAMASAPRALGS